MKTILVVDDSSSLRVLVRLALERVGYDVVEASDGREAIAALRDAQPSLIVCDVNMPHVDGLAFARHVKQTALHRFVPVVMLTTSIDPATRSAARSAGVQAWITKPFKTGTLVGAVQRLCV